MSFDAAILDVDGVITRTAGLHERAWKTLFDEVLAQHRDPRPFTHDDYRHHVDGKPRVDGLQDFLASRGIHLPPDAIDRLARRKNELFQALLAEDGVDIFDDAVRQVQAWRRSGLGVAFVSSSRNVPQILEQTGLNRLCDVQVDGLTAQELGLAGKPELFREAAQRLAVEPPRAFVIEDSESGVQAAAEGGFGLVVGVARDGDGQGLSQHGAHRVVRNLDELPDLVEPGTRPARTLPSALRMDLLDARLGHREPVVFLDFDGTLVDSARRPEQVTLGDEVREALRALARHCTVGVVSGRDRADVERRVGLEGLWYLGCHGFDVRSPEGATFTVQAAEAAQPLLDALLASFQQEFADEPGIRIERKRFVLGLDFRDAAPEGVARCLRRAREVAEASDPLRLHLERSAVELWPDVDWNKGRAIERVLERLEVRGAVSAPLYVGDGYTDEDAFRSIQHIGVTVVVDPPGRPTHAAMQLRDPGEVRELLQSLAGWLGARTDLRQWALTWETYEPEHERHREALCTLGNGVFATRGAAEWASRSASHYPGTYLAGGYDPIATQIRGEVLVHEDLVNWPNWLCLTFRPEGGAWLDLEQLEVLEHRQGLDLRRGVLRRHLRVRDTEGRETRLLAERIVSMADPHLGAIRWEVVPENWLGILEVRSGLDGTVQNAGVERYRALRGDHLVPEATGQDGEDRIWLTVRTQGSRIRMAQVARTQVIRGQEEGPRRREEFPGRIEQRIRLRVERGQPVELDKVVALHSTLDPAIVDPLTDARARAAEAPGYPTLRVAHERRWGRIWRRTDIRLGAGHEASQRILRAHILHLMQVTSPHIADRDVGVPARGLHGEAYRGHIFWDELFIFPFLNYAMPELSRELLMYRYRRLDVARRRARAHGRRGAMYPWQSGANGEEESPRLNLSPTEARWVPEETHLQRHIGAAIAYNIWQYHEVTGDHEFLSFYGAEMMLEIARYYASLAEWDEGLQRYRIRGVVGPDEFHTRYPGADQPGVDDNAYTNVMAAWCLRTAERALEALGDERQAELLDDLGITHDDQARWQRIASRMRVVFLDDHLISEFDGWGDLEELDWEHYRRTYGDVQRMDRILEQEGDTTHRYKLAKQADVLMLFYLFTAQELTGLFHAMGYRFEPEWIPENIDYYAQRTSHGSTLSRVAHGWVLARSDRAGSWRIFQEALQSDVSDIQGGSTAEGIHLGAMAGTVDLVQRGYTGASVRDGVLWLEPQLPDDLSELKLRFRVRSAWLDVHLTHDTLQVSYSTGQADRARVGFAGSVHELGKGDRRIFTLREPEPAPAPQGTTGDRASEQERER